MMLAASVIILVSLAAGLMVWRYLIAIDRETELINLASEPPTTGGVVCPGGVINRLNGPSRSWIYDPPIEVDANASIRFNWLTGEAWINDRRYQGQIEKR